jgi:hypothetical protein
MPAQTQHAEQAEHNFKAASFIVENSEFFDWSATIAFYSAVHFVESSISFLSDSDAKLLYFNHSINIKHSNDLQNKELYPSYSGKPLSSPHAIRRQIIARNFVDIRDSYNLLEDASSTQRYTNYKQNDSVKCRKLIDKHLTKIKSWHDSLVSLKPTNEQNA